MPTAIDKNRELIGALKLVVNALEDGQVGMAEIADHLQDEALKRFFLAESLRRASFRGDLEGELHRQGVPDIHETGTVTGALYRAWADLKSL